MEADSLKENSMKEDSMKENSMKTDSMKADSLKEDSLKESSLKEDSLKEGFLKDEVKSSSEETDVFTVVEPAKSEDDSEMTNPPEAADSSDAGTELPYVMNGAEQTDSREGNYIIRFHEDFDEEHAESFTQEIPFGEETRLSGVPWQHEGYRFAGWYTDAAGVNHNLANAYRDGAVVLDLGRQEGDVIDLWAGWYKE